jgi:hypothetical protein
MYICKTIEDVLNIKIGDQFYFECEECGNLDHKLRISSKTKIMNNTHLFLCKKCSIKKSRAIVKELREKTMLKKYGCTNPGQMPNHKEKINNTKMNKSEEEKQIEFNNRSKARIEFYSSDRGKESRKKQQESFIKKYQVTSISQLNKTKETILNKYGCDNMSDLQKMPEIRNKIIETNNERYGCNCTFQSEQVKEKSKKTCLKKYGVEYNCQRKECFSRKLYKYDNKNFDSSWELAYYLWLKYNNIQFEYHSDKLEFSVNNETHYYFPDFKINDMYIEIKGDHFFENGHMINPSDRSKDYIAEAKYNFMKSINTKILLYNDLKDIINWANKNYDLSLYKVSTNN